MHSDALQVSDSELATAVHVSSIDWSPFTLGQSSIIIIATGISSSLMIVSGASQAMLKSFDCVRKLYGICLILS